MSHKHELTMHDDFHLMLPNHLDVNRKPVYEMYPCSDEATYKDFFKITDSNYIPLAYDWLIYRIVFDDSNSLTICRRCIVNIYANIPILAYDYSYKYFLLCEIMGHMKDDDFITHMIKNISWLVIELLKTPSLWDEIGHGVNIIVLQK